METKDWLTVAVTLIGPIAAVQAQKWVERARASSQRKDLIFTTLMATRQARVSFDHVRALNMIDIAYYGTRFPLLGGVWRSKREKAVLTAWHTYHARLNLPPERRPTTEAEERDWTGHGDELFTNLMERLALSNSFDFERDQLKTGSYSPEAHGTVERQQQAVRKLAIDVMTGAKSLPLEVKAWPVDPEVAAQQRGVLADMVSNQRELLTQLADILEQLTDRATGAAAETAAPTVSLPTDLVPAPRR